MKTKPSDRKEQAGRLTPETLRTLADEIEHENNNRLRGFLREDMWRYDSTKKYLSQYQLGIYEPTAL